MGLFFGLAGVAGCDSQPDQDELQALLHDDDLTSLIGTARVAAERGDGGGAGFNGFPFGTWFFDDCNAARTNLGDSSPSGNTAFRSVGVTCAPGIAGQAVSLGVKEDIVYVPDQPDFTFESGLTVAGWVNPTSITGTRTLIRKRDRGTSSFALVLNSTGKFQFVVNLGAKAISVTSPQKATPGVFQHVAGTYDGNTLRLYVNGFEVKGLGATGTVPPGPGPLLIGNDGSERRFDGLIDNVHFEGRALSNAEVLALTCIRQFPTFEVTPQVSDPTPPGVPASFDVAVTNRNGGNCAPLTFQFRQDNFFVPGITIDPPSFQPITSPPVANGATTHFTMTATADASVEPQTFFLGFQLFATDGSFFTFGSVLFVVDEPLGCHVSTPRELMIKNVSVVDDPVRTTNGGVWTFRHLMESMAPTPEDAPAMVEAMMRSFTTTQTINGFDVAPRPNVEAFILNGWPRTPDGALDLDQAPLRLLAIVNRFDLRNLANGDAGEGRFVFGFISPGFFPLEATMILEYKLPAADDTDVLGWAQAFHALGALPFGEEYNAALQGVTEAFVARGARPGQINDSAISVVRTNELNGDNIRWQLREFVLSPVTGMLVPATVKLTPDVGFNNTDTLAGFINDNEASILAETHTVPDQLLGQSFAAGAVFNDFFNFWSAPGINNNEARHHFALNTCNGCHSQRETGTSFLQIFPRFPGNESNLSGFLTGITVFDPQDGQPRTFNDLGRRKADLNAVVCGGGAAGTMLPKGIDRVH